jgi:hypothetical protein
VNRTRAWILGAAAGCFLAGLAVGFALPDVFAEAPAADPDDEFVHRMIADFQLNTEQSRLLRIAVRTGREEELRVFRQFQLTQLPDEMQNRLREARNRLVQRTRKILQSNPDQLARYDSMVAAEGSK